MNYKLALFALLAFLIPAIIGGTVIYRQNAKLAESANTESELKRFQKRAEALTAHFSQQQQDFHDYYQQFPNCSTATNLITNQMFSPEIDFQSPLTGITTHTLSLKKLAERGLSFYPATKDTSYLKTTIDESGAIALTIDHQAFKAITDKREQQLSNLEILDFYVLVHSKKHKNTLCKMGGRLHISPEPLPKQTHELVNIFGRMGQKWGEFTLPYGTDYRADSKQIVISDCSNGLIQEFDQSGRLTKLFGGKGKGLAQLDTPADVKYHDGQYYVVEERNHRYQVFDEAGKSLFSNGTLTQADTEPRAQDVDGGSPHFNYPLGIALDDEGYIYVVDYGNDRIQKLTPEGKFVMAFGDIGATESEKLKGPYYIEFHPQNKKIYVSDRGKDRIVIFDKNGQFDSSFGATGDKLGQFKVPHELHIDSDGTVWVADTNNYRVQHFSANGEFLDVIIFNKSFGLPKTVVTTPEGLIFIGHLGKEAYMTVWQKADSSVYETQWKQTDITNKTTPEALKTYIQLSNKRAQESVYGRLCAACHAGGTLGAPRTKVAEDWERFPRDIDKLMELAKQGRGAMLPRGGCDECSDGELRDAILFMLPSKWEVDK